MTFEDFLEYLKTEDKSEHTIRGYAINLPLFVHWFEQTTGQQMTPANVTPLDLLEYRRHLLAAKKAPGTINRKLGYLRAYFEWCLTQGLIPSNPATKIKYLPSPLASPKWLTRSQIYALLRAADEALQLAQVRQRQHRALEARRNKAIVALMLFAGLRISEVVALQRDDIELRSRSGQVTIWQGKGRKYRRVPLNLDARQALADWLEVWTGQNIFDNLVDGRTVSTRTIQDVVRELGKKAGIPGLTPHQLRHSFAKSLVDAGVTLDKVARLLGHSNLTVTAIYTQPSEADLQKAVDTIAWSD